MLRRPSSTAAAASMARNVGGALGRRRGLSLPELQRAAFSEMMRHVRQTRGETVVPTRYVVRLHPADATTVEAAPRFFTAGLGEALRNTCDEHGWSLDGSIDIDVEADSSRLPGVPAVFAVPPDAPVSAAPIAPPETAATVAAAGAPARATITRRQDRVLLHRLDTDERIPLTGDAVTIGRAPDQDVVIDDSRVSRHHAVVRQQGSAWAVVDEGSSNGTRLNGSTLAARRATTLRPGDSIEIGPLRLRFDVDRPPAAAGSSRGQAGTDPPTMTLDAATRHRISAEHIADDAPGRQGGNGA